MTRLQTLHQGLLLLAWSGALAAAEAPRSITALVLRPEETITLDGVLDEAAWARADVAGGFVQRLPREGEPSSFRTEVRVAYDDDTLYVGAMLFDPNPAAVLARQRARDANLDTDDVFSFVLDTFSDGRTGYLFETNPAGLLRDALLSGGPNDSWDAIWDVRARRNPDGWAAEFAIPFRALNFDPNRSAWSVNFERVVRHANETSRWTGFRRTQGLFSTLYAGEVEGLRGLDQGRGLELRPYVVARAQRFAGGSANDDFDAGFDLTYSIAPNLRAALTFNTDFADTEVDNRELNLGRFPIRFPEKRDFFLEGSAVYEFPGDSRVTPYYSRRIGLTRDGPVPVKWGGRLAGQVGRFDLGLLQMHTGAAFGREAEDFTVFRTRANLGEENYAGLLFTRRAGAEDRDRYTVGLDTRLRVIDWGDGQRYAITPYVIWTSRAPGDTTSDFSDRAIFGMQNSVQYGGANLSASFHRTGENYNPAVGFAFDTDYTEIDTRFSYEYEPPFAVIQRVEHQVSYARRDDLAGNLIDAEGEWGIADIELRSGDSAELSVDWQAEQLDEDFEIWDGVIVPVGRYDGWGVSFDVHTAEKRAWSLDGGIGRRQFFGGHRTSLEIGGEWRPAPGLELSLSAEQDEIALPEGSFTTQLYSGRVRYDFTTRHSLSVLAQYDNDSDSVGVQVRFRWWVRPGAEIFLGYLHDWAEEVDPLTGRSRWATLGRESIAKASYSWWF